MRATISPLRLTAAAAVYAATAAMDVFMTLRGVCGNPEFEGNPIIRAMMSAFGVETGLFAEKVLVGLVCAAIAVICEPAVKRKAPWIFRLTLFERTKAWLRSGERSWIAFLPLYGVAAFQILAALSWAWIDPAHCADL